MFVFWGFENPKNVGAFPADIPHVYNGLVGAPACGDVMKLQIKVDNDIITQAVFKTFGCGSAIASSEFATEFLLCQSIQHRESSNFCFPNDSSF